MVMIYHQKKSVVSKSPCIRRFLVSNLKFYLFYETSPFLWNYFTLFTGFIIFFHFFLRKNTGFWPVFGKEWSFIATYCSGRISRLPTITVNYVAYFFNPIKSKPLFSNGLFKKYRITVLMGNEIGAVKTVEIWRNIGE